MKEKYRVALFPYHPVPYQVPLYRALHEHPRVRETVCFLDDLCVTGVYEKTFQRPLKWDIPVLDGYNHRFLYNLSSNTHLPVIGRVNPGAFTEIFSGGYDAIVLTGYTMLTVYFCMISAKCTGTKILLRSEATSDKKTSGIFARIKKLLLPRVLSACDAILYSCEKNRRYFRQFGVPDRKLFPVLSSVDNDFFSRSMERTRAKRASERNRLNIGKDDLVFLFLAQMSPRKRPNDAIEGFRILSSSFPNSHLIIVGDGPLLSRLKKDVARTALKNIHFAGFKNASEIPTFLGISDIMLITSEYDPSPKALNEAMISGLPSIVSSAIGTAGDLLKHDHNGLIFPVGDTDQLGHYMKVLAGDPQKRALFGKAAMEYASAWSPKANAEGIVQALDYCFSGPES